MIHFAIPGWQRRVSGTTTYLLAPEGTEAGIITVMERVRPVVRLVDLVRDLGEVVEGPTAITSDEGEYGAFVSLRGGGVQHDIGMLVGDEFLCTVIGVTALTEHFARSRDAVCDLLRRAPLILGVRRRLFHYAPPAGWREVARGLDAEHYPPDFPRDPSRLTVYAALPIGAATPAEALAALVAKQSQELAAAQEAGWVETIRTTDRGLAFQYGTTRAGDWLLSFAVAADATYLYALRLETPIARPHRTAFEAVVDSVVPIDIIKQPTLSGLTHFAD